MSKIKGLVALSPLMVFVALYLVTSIIANDFYKVPISVAFLISSVFAVLVIKCGTVAERVSIFSRGAGTEGIMLMLWIFVLAGAFANSAKTIGSIDATVNLMLRILPDGMLLPGLFLATCFISFSIGTSVGTIVALVPLAAGLATSTGASVPLLTAVVVGGSFFGDNLSFISDTTIAATTSQKCKMSDKFKANSFLAFPTAFVILVVYIIMGLGLNVPDNLPEVDYFRVIPYLVVIVTAVIGMNVMTVLVIGIILTGFIGIIEGTFNLYGWFSSMGEGILGMGELIIITMLAGGLFELVRQGGGIEYIIKKITSRIHGKRGAELIIAFLVSVVDVCTANNTVAIITVGGIARQISKKFEIDNRKTASILDTFSCCVQGIIPYGAQLLMAAELAKLAPTEVMPYLYYPYTLGLFSVFTILIRWPKRYS